MHWPRYVACSLCPREFYERALNWASDLIAERTYDVRKTCQLPIWGLERAKDAHRRRRTAAERFKGCSIESGRVETIVWVSTRDDVSKVLFRT